jgi:hypothetical protein
LFAREGTKLLKRIQRNGLFVSQVAILILTQSNHFV